MTKPKAKIAVVYPKNRKSKSLAPTQVKLLGFRCSAAYHKKVSKAARNSGESISEFIRNAVNGAML